MNKEDLIKELTKAKEVTKDYGKFKHLFSEDEGERTLAELNKTLGRIEMLMKASDMKELAHPKNKALEKPVLGRSGLVKIRPCAEEYGNKTFLGFLIGEIALGSSITLTDDKIQLNFSNHNPAIFVPELNKVIYGIESWWGEIESEDELKQITNEDIDNVWYVRLMRKMAEKKENEGSGK